MNINRENTFSADLSDDEEVRKMKFLLDLTESEKEMGEVSHQKKRNSVSISSNGFMTSNNSTSNPSSTPFYRTSSSASVNSRKKQDDNSELSRDNVIVFVNSTPPSNLLCPIHGGLFIQPVIAKCGHTFCRPCLLKYIESDGSQSSECPIDKNIFKKKDLRSLIPNIVVAESISTLKVYCKYGCKLENGKWIKDTNGCPEEITLASREQHENVCPYALICCPFNKSCSLIRRMDLENHLKQCAHVTCPHKKIGCTFQGDGNTLKDHLAGCPYENIKGFIDKNHKQVNKLKKKLKEKDEEIRFLKGALTQLNTKIDYLVENFESKTNNFEISLRKMNASLDHNQIQLGETRQEVETLKHRLKRPANELYQQGEIIDIIDPPVNLNCKGTFTGHKGPVWGLAVTAGGLLVSASSDATIKIWDVMNFKCKKTLTGHEGIVHAVVVHENKICSGSEDKSLRIWDLNTLECLRVIRVHDNTICSLATVNGILFSGSYQEIKVWDLNTYECIQTLTGHNHWIRAITATSEYLYTGSYNIIKIWDLKSTPYNCIRTITGNYGSIYCLAVSVEYNRLLTGTYENKINVYDLITYKPITSLDGHIGAVYALAISGNRFFSGSYDSTIKVWNLENFKSLQTLVRHSSSVDALVSAGGCIFSGGADHSVKVWR